MQRSVLVIYTGGTIGMAEDPLTGTLKPFDFESLQSHVPELARLDIMVHTIAFEHPIDSSDVDIHHWQQIASLIETHYQDYNGFVVLHGTDTIDRKSVV